MSQPHKLKLPALCLSPERRRKISFAILLLLVTGFFCARVRAEERGPSTKEERTKAVDFAHKLETDPLNPSAEEWRVWLAQWIDEVPDIVVPVCPGLLPQLVHTKRNYSHELAMQVVYSSAAFIVEHPDQQVDQQAVFLAGVEGALRSYEAILKAHPKARWYFLDNLIQMRNKGELKEYLRKQIDDNCVSGLPA